MFVVELEEERERETSKESKGGCEQCLLSVERIVVYTGLGGNVIIGLREGLLVARVGLYVSVTVAHVLSD